MFSALNDAELALIEAVKEGREADLAGKSPLRVEVVRHLLLQISDPAIPDWMTNGGKLRWAIRGAKFDGRLDLHDAQARDGGPLPSLDFQGCTFMNGFDGSNTSFARLRFADCIFQYVGSDEAEQSIRLAPINLCNARIASELRLKHLKPCSDKALFWVYAKGLVVGGSIRFHGVHLRAPKHEPVLRDGSTRFGLDLEAARVSANLRLHPDVQIDGGVRLQNAKIDGNLWADGLYVSDGEDEESRGRIIDQDADTAYGIRYAFDLQSGQIGGVLVFRTYIDAKYKVKRASCVGSLSLLGSQVSGGIYFDGLRVEDVQVTLVAKMAEYLERKKQDPSTSAPISEPLPCFVNMKYAIIGGIFSMESIPLPVEILRPSISGALHMEGSTVKGNVSIEAKLTEIRLDGCSVSGDFTLRGTAHAFEAPRLSIGGDCILAAEFIEGATVDLRRSTVGGSMDISLLRFRKNYYSAQSFFYSRPISIHRLSLRGVTIARTLAVTAYLPIFASARKANLKCWPGYSLIEIRVTKSYDSDADRFSWRGYPTAFVTFLCDESRREGHVIDGHTLASGKVAFSPLQQMAANARRAMSLDSDEVVQDYLRLFCACLYAEDSDLPFSIAESETDLPRSLQGTVNLAPVGVPVRSEVDGKKLIEVTGVLRANGGISRSVFRLHEEGHFSPEGEEPLLEEVVREQRYYEMPFRFGEDAGRPDYSPLAQGAPITLAEVEFLLPDWRNALSSRGRLSKSKIDLREATCATLQDEGGSAWQGAKLSLENFTYSHLVSSKSGLREVEERKKLLRNQPSNDFFELQTYHNSYREALPHLKAAPYIEGNSTRLTLVQAAAEEMNGWFKHSDLRIRTNDLSFSRVIGLIEELRSEPNLPWLNYHLEWLTRKSTSNSLLQEPFHPQPYSQISRVLNDQGDEEGWREIEKEKLGSQLDHNISRAKDALRRGQASEPKRKFWRFGAELITWNGLKAWKWFYGRGFGFGLEPVRALFTLVICWVAGWTIVAAANHTRYLVATTSTVASAIGATDDGDAPVFLKNAQPPFLPELQCGGNINQFLYAVDTFTPLLNLHQESRCDLRSPHSKEAAFIPRTLEVMKFIYKGLGYLVTSLAVLTFSGIARRWDK